MEVRRQFKKIKEVFIAWNIVNKNLLFKFHYGAVGKALMLGNYDNVSLKSNNAMLDF